MKPKVIKETATHIYHEYAKGVVGVSPKSTFWVLSDKPLVEKGHDKSMAPVKS